MVLPTRTKRGRLPRGPCGASEEDWTSPLECIVHGPEPQTFLGDISARKGP